MKLIYFFVRMWAPPDECQDPEVTRYVAKVDHEGGGTSWTMVKKFTDAHYFEVKAEALSVLATPRIRGRIDDGWLYEIIRVEEEIISTNVPEEETESV